jgi:hypothetical protein
MQEIKEDIKEIKNILKTFADNKVKEQKTIEEETADIKAKKEILQSINKATALALQNIKKL